MAGFGYGIAFSGEPDDNYLQLFEQARRRKADEENARRAAEEKRRQEANRQMVGDADKFNQEFAKVNPIYRSQLQQYYNEYADQAGKLMQSNPYDYAFLPEYNSARTQMWGRVNDLVKSSDVANKLINLDPKYAYIPEYAGIAEALRNNDLQSLIQITGNEGGLLNGQYYYEDKDLDKLTFDEVEKYAKFYNDGTIKTESLGNGMMKTLEIEKRNPAEVKALLEGIYDQNHDVVKYKYKEYDGKKDKWVADQMAKIQMEKKNPSAMNLPKADNDNDSDGDGGEDYAVENYVNRVKAVTSGDGWEAAPAKDGMFPGSKINYLLRGYSLKPFITTEGKKVDNQIDYITELPNGTWWVKPTYGEAFEVKDRDLYQFTTVDYLENYGKPTHGVKYNKKIEKRMREEGLIRDYKPVNATSGNKNKAPANKAASNKPPKIDTKGLTGIALIKARQQNAANGY